MAKTTVPHTGGECQEGFEKNHQTIFESYRNGFDITKLLAVEVFDGGNDRAADILMFCGFDKLISGTNCASIGDVAEFYGINHQYLKEAMRRYGVGAKDLPEDVFIGQYYDFIVRFGDEIRNRHTLKSCNEPGAFAIYDTFTKRTMVVKGDYRCKMTYISARVILMLSCFLFYGKCPSLGKPQNRLLYGPFLKKVRNFFLTASMELCTELLEQLNKSPISS